MRSTSAVGLGASEDPDQERPTIPVATFRASLTAARTHLDDLQAEIEAGSRCVDRIAYDASTIDGRVKTHLRHSERLAALLRCSAELRESIEEQQNILRELRASVNRMRRAMRVSK